MGSIMETVVPMFSVLEILKSASVIFNYFVGKSKSYSRTPHRALGLVKLLLDLVEGLPRGYLCRCR